MGYLRHKALLVNGWDGDTVAAARAAVAKLYAAHDDMAGLVSPLVPHAMNGGASFLIAPDGSKEGWHHSALGDHLMLEAKETIARYEWVDWCEILCGGDDDEFAVVAASGMSAGTAETDGVGNADGTGSGPQPASPTAKPGRPNDID